MGAVRRLVLDTLKPLEPTIIELAQQISELPGVDSVNISIYEIDRKVENAKLTIEGPDISYESVEALIRDRRVGPLDRRSGRRQVDYRRRLNSAGLDNNNYKLNLD